MNQVKAILKMNADELLHSIAGTTASWHEQYRGNAWVFAGGFVEQLSEGDILAVFSQYGEIEDLHLVRDEETGKSKGFSFLKYENEKSCVLAVDNLNGYMLLGKTLRVDHTDYRPPKKKKKQIDIEEANGETYIGQTAGHAYAGKELATNHSLTEGVDIFDTSKDPRPVAALPSVVVAPPEATSSNRMPLGNDKMKRKRERAAVREERRLKKMKKESKSKKKKKEKKEKKEKKKKKSNNKEKKEKKKKIKKKNKKKTKDNASSSSSSSDSSDEDEEIAKLRQAQRFIASNKA